MTIYRINNYATNPTWIDISPSTGYEVVYPYGLSVDTNAPNQLAAAAYGGITQRLFVSSDQGQIGI
jgi:hypothetical protein